VSSIEMWAFYVIEIKRNECYSAYALCVFQSRNSVVRTQMISRENISYFHDW